MPTITRKIELKLCTEGLSEEERKAQWKLLYHINDNLYRSANNISSKLYLDSHVGSMVRLKHKDYLETLTALSKAQKKDDTALITELEARLSLFKSEMSDQEIAICKYATEMSERTLADHFASELELDIYSQILTQVKDVVQKYFKDDSKEVSQGLRSIRTYKKGMPIPFPWRNNIWLEAVEAKKQRGNDKKYDYFIKWYGGIRFQLMFGKDRSNNEQIVRRCLKMDENCNDNYQMRTSSIQMKKGAHGTELFLLLVVDIPQEQHKLNNKIVVGVDLGINVPAYVATNVTYDRCAIGSSEGFLAKRNEFRNRFRSLQKLKGTAGGRGRTKKLEPLERLRDKERNWVHTQNHLYSRDVVNFAIKVKAATIQMEDLKGYGKDENGEVVEEKKFLLGRWSYYELQKLIQYKAEKAGMKVNYINPRYTSQTCSCCGVRDPEARNGVHFICRNPACEMYGKEEHADYNAAVNIARSKDINK